MQKAKQHIRALDNKQNEHINNKFVKK